MTIWEILYQFLFMPLQLVFEEIYYFAYRVTQHPGVSIIALSFIINFLLLPLYRRADTMQEAAKNIEMELQPVVQHIKKHFKGDEQLMMLQTYYEQNNYSPLDIVKGSISLFLEIPFFVAAYQFLSHLQILQGVSLGPIRDLGAQDGLLTLGGLTINLLPIIMTLINVYASYLFTQGYPLKTKIQLQGMALFFLVFLYKAPAGLVFYWTLNNLFNLVKTIVNKMQNPKKGIFIALGLCSIAMLIFTFGYMLPRTTNRLIMGTGIACLLNMPCVGYYFWRMLQKHNFHFSFGNKETIAPAPNRKLFLSAGAFLAVLTGLLIPLSVIESSPQEFVIINYLHNPLWYAVSSGAIALGFFGLWFGVFYWLSSLRGKVIFERLLWLFAVMAITNYMFFGKNLGILSPTLQYENGMHFSMSEKLINLATLILLLSLLGYTYNRYKKYIPEILSIGTIASLVLCGINITHIQQSINKINFAEAGKDISNKKILTLSKTGKNVVIIMLDRALGEYVPYIFAEKPELKQQFEGFTYYSNVISFGGHTIHAAPALFGGHEYTPLSMNLRQNKRLVDKHNESLKVLPTIFANNGFDVSLYNLPFGNYQWISDLSIFSNMDRTTVFSSVSILEKVFSADDTKHGKKKYDVNKRNHYIFALTKCSPLYVQNLLYDNGKYAILTKTKGQSIKSLYCSVGINYNFYKEMMLLDKLSQVTKIVENGDKFNIFVSDITHHPCNLQKPDYTVFSEIDNSKVGLAYNSYVVDGRKLRFDKFYHVTHYHVNIASLQTLGEWIKFLKENNVYNNTRIIIVSDHGYGVDQLKELVLDNNNSIIKNIDARYGDAEFFYPLLMVKDFNSMEKECITSSKFMTNADVPFIAINGLIDMPKNPFTGNFITLSKEHSKNYILSSSKFGFEHNKGSQFPAGRWYSVHDNIWDKKNWKLEKENAVLPY